MICDYIDTFSPNFAAPNLTLCVLLLRCAFIIQLEFNVNRYDQTDGVTMGSSLGLVPSDISMSSLEHGFLRDSIKYMSSHHR